MLFNVYIGYVPHAFVVLGFRASIARMCATDGVRDCLCWSPPPSYLCASEYKNLHALPSWYKCCMRLGEREDGHEEMHCHREKSLVEGAEESVAAYPLPFCLANILVFTHQICRMKTCFMSLISRRRRHQHENIAVLHFIFRQMTRSRQVVMPGHVCAQRP